MQASDHSLGSYLRSIREQQGMNLQDVMARTKIQPKFIEALEADAYHQLPKGPFVVGFLRTYAQCLSLSADEVVAFYLAHYGRQRQSSPVSQRSSPQPSARRSRASWQRGVTFSGAFAALICALLLALWNRPVGQQAAHEDPVGAAADEPLAAHQVVSTAEVAPLPSQPVTLSQTASPYPLSHPLPSIGAEAIATETQPADAAPSETLARDLSEVPTLELAPLILRVQALEETWMRLDIDDKTRQETLIKAGQSIEWKANQQFSLTLGNVKGARVLLNDQELDLPETRSNVLRDYVLTRALLHPRHTD